MSSSDSKEQLDYELRKLFKDYSVGVSAGMNATRPKTVDDAEEHLQAVITLAKDLIDRRVREAEERVMQTLTGYNLFENGEITLFKGEEIVAKGYFTQLTQAEDKK